MESGYIEDGVKTRLLISGINEIEEHGINDFSLRRAALGAQVSCAAPYRHFKDKDEYINEIIKYIGSRLFLLCNEIKNIFKDDNRKLILELSMANLRFWLANSNYRSVLLHSPETGKTSNDSRLMQFDTLIDEAVESYCRECGLDDKAELKKYNLRTLIYGTVMLMSTGDYETNEKNLATVKKIITEEFA